MSDVWYREGLAFRCTRCGHCCTGAPGFVWVNDDELAAIAEHRGESVAEVTALYTRPVRHERSLREQANGDCVFFDRATGCTVYPVRPRQCRTWPFWESTVRTPDDWERTREGCPGAGQGDIIPAAEIAWRVSRIKL